MKHDPFDWIADSLNELEARGLRRRLRQRESPPVAGVIQIDGIQYLNFSSNDYLGIAADCRVVDVVKRFVGYHGWGSGASALISGRGALHAELERRLAELKGTERALLFPTGYAANLGVVSALVGKGDFVFSDAKNHASIIDGCRLSGAQTQVYRHNDLEHLESLLSETTTAGKRLIVTDTVFSMDGDLADLPKLIELAGRHSAMVVIDEAHATGVFGTKGRGCSEHFAVDPSRIVQVGTLSKALGSLGGFVAGSEKVVDWVLNRARSYMFSTAAPEVVCAATIESLKIVAEEPHRRLQLWSSISELQSKFAARGIHVHAQSPIVPILVGDPDKCVELSKRVAERGIFCPAIRPPTVPVGESMLRISLSSAHTSAMLDRLVEAVADESRALDLSIGSTS